MADHKNHTLLQSSFPVLLPYFPELLSSDSEFLTHIKSLNVSASGAVVKDSHVEKETDQKPNPSTQTSPFIEALSKSGANVHTSEILARENKTLTENADVALISSTNVLVDLFYELKDDDIHENALQSAWKEDPVATLKILFNVRSIHLGKGERVAAYRAFGWLYQNHPQTFLLNLPWIVRPVIPKPKPASPDAKEAKNVDEMDEDDFEVVELDSSAYATTSLDQEHGLAHGYWKDLLNMLVLAAHGEFRVDGNVRELLNIPAIAKTANANRKRKRSVALDKKNVLGKKNREWDHEKAKASRKDKRTEQWQIVVDKLRDDTNYRAFHLATARLFGEQLKRDFSALTAGQSGYKNISLAGKWAPTLKGFHDMHTFLASSIAEIMFPHDDICPEIAKDNRELYLKHARVAYQLQILSPLRKAIDIVERHITAETFKEIKYERVPSLALNQYENLFATKDLEHFTEYVEKVALGKKKISGAILLPSVLVHKASEHDSAFKPTAKIQAELQSKILDGQWKSLVERIKLSGKIESSIAVCDVSGSMTMPVRPDKTTPMDSAIGLSLLLAEVCQPPFGGNMITFSNDPSFITVGGANDKRSFVQKINHIKRAQWGMSTDFEAVFERLILPLAKEHKLKQEDMVKQVFVFSDMQFNQASSHSNRWYSSFERIEKHYRKAGYEMPTLIFWNLASHTTGVPVGAKQPGTVLVSGYSQGQMKMFLDNGGFEDQEEETVVDMEDGEEVMITKEKAKVDPLTALKKAISHPAYSMLKVVD
jgi:Domain of unknown function (DUF2828)